jgi:integrase/recombinase XerD
MFSLKLLNLQMGKTNRKGKSKVLDTIQLDELIQNLPLKHHKLIASICRNTACRISEACQLKWEDIRPDKKIYFPKEITKGKLKPREIPINQELLNELMQYKNECSHLKAENTSPNCYVFKSRNPNEHFSVRGFQHALKAAIERTNLQGTSSHSFRRTSLTTAHNAGVPTRHLMAVSGHASMDTLAGYLEVKDEDLVNATNLFA